METPAQKIHQLIDKIHLGYLGILPAIATFPAFTIHRPPPFLMLLGGTVVVSVYLAVVFSYWQPSPSPAVGLLALLDGPIIAALAQFG